MKFNDQTEIAGVTRSWTLDDARMMATMAREAGNMPRVHPNGFIQLDLDEQIQGWQKKKGHSGGNIRLHIWNPPEFNLPHQKTTNEIHDHVFDMRSTVVKGRLIQKLFWFVVGDEVRTHELYRAVYDKKSSSRLESLEVYGTLRQHDSELVSAEQSYLQPAFTLHETGAYGCVVTIMQKEHIYDGIPVVVCEVDNAPDNHFDRASAASTDYLWKAIESALS